MRFRRLWPVLALLLCAAMIIVAPPSSTLAYLAANSNTVRNTFRVEYLPAEDITVPVSVHKTVQSLGKENISPSGFSFCLMNLDTAEAVKMISGIDGGATMKLVFTAEDAGKSYRYRLYEINDGQPGVEYDEAYYDIRISIALNDELELSAALILDGQPVEEIVAEFENIYNPIEIPDTGDHAQPLLWLALLVFSGACLMLLGRKNKAFIRRP